ncbi:hypothetical protein Taro_010333 [Colocasia esculenta]|uniref:Uncharacterized protein n=1 Tax=Colocasia esculenta TaxID=4460 RepID=A0A843U6M9_COLES|nr:hypothetical protein [Colocasia esculenta]
MCRVVNAIAQRVAFTLPLVGGLHLHGCRVSLAGRSAGVVGYPKFFVSQARVFVVLVVLSRYLCGTVEVCVVFLDTLTPVFELYVRLRERRQWDSHFPEFVLLSLGALARDPRVRPFVRDCEVERLFLCCVVRVGYWPDQPVDLCDSWSRFDSFEVCPGVGTVVTELWTVAVDSQEGAVDRWHRQSLGLLALWVSVDSSKGSVDRSTQSSYPEFRKSWSVDNYGLPVDNRLFLTHK